MPSVASVIPPADPKIARLRELHREVGSSGGPTCATCLQSWPCTVEVLRRRIEELEAVLEVSEPAVDLDARPDHIDAETWAAWGHAGRYWYRDSMAWSDAAKDLSQRLVDTTTALERADDFLQAWFEWQPEDDPSPRFGAVVQAGARLRAALAAVAPAPPTPACRRCDHGTDPATLTTCADCEGTGLRPVAAAPPTEPTDG